MFVASLVVLAVIALGAAYVIGTQSGRAVEQAIVVKVLAQYVKDEAEAETYVSRILGNLRYDYTTLYSRVLSRLFRDELAAKREAATLAKEAFKL